MKVLEERFNRPHPELINHRPVPAQLIWLQSAFLRLHRRRRLSEQGILQPLTLHEIVDFAERNLQVPKNLWPLFSWVMEETDNAVMEDYYAARSKDKEKAS